MNKTKQSEGYVFDTSALLTLWNNEEGADEVERLLRSNALVHVSFMTCMEARYRIWKNVSREASEEFRQYLDLLRVNRVDATPAILEKAVEVKATHSLSVCDSWIIATAIALDATLVHKDPDFEQVVSTVKLIALPYKVRRTEKAKK
jgi:predicted nucleic acid-binding protein